MQKQTSTKPLSHSHTTDQDPRFTPIEGALNFRDFGGYPTQDGRKVKTGYLFRCGSLANIPIHAHDDFAQLNIGVICDLRREDEVILSPTLISMPFQCQVHIPIAPGSSPQLQSSLQNSSYNHEDQAAFMQTISREIARDNVDAYQKLFHQLLEAKKGFLLHCSAGKDRTGFGAAMILTSLGVHEELIFEDYLLTNRADELFTTMLSSFRKKYGDNMVDEASLRIIAGVRREYLAAALDELRYHFGSVNNYLTVLGVDEAAKQTLRQRLLD